MKVFTNRKILKRVGNPDIDFLIDDLQRNVAKTRKMFVKEIAVRSELMRRSCDFKEFHELNLDANSMNFFHNSTLLIRFFQELAVEHVQLSDLSEHDSYQTYVEHIEILEEIQGRYLSKLFAIGMDDMISMPLTWWNNEEVLPIINTAWVKEHKVFEFYYDGILSRFDLSMIRALSKTLKDVEGAEVKLFVQTDAWFQKSILRLDEYGSFEADKVYLIDVMNDTHQVISDFKPKTNAKLNVVSMTSMFAPYVKKSIEKLINNDVDPIDIAVVYTDESIRPMLELYADDVLSFDHTDTLFEMRTFRILRNILRVAEKTDLKNGLRNSLYLPEAKVLIREVSAGHVSLDFINKIATNLTSNISVSFSVELLNHLADVSENDMEHDLIVELIHIIDRYADAFDGSTLSDILEFCLYHANLLKDETSYEKGKIRAYDFLGTRGISVKHLIVVGFEKGFVPRPVKKDLFLDTNIRLASEMPIYSDRINMQLHYWQSLFTKADNIKICFHDGDNADVSLFAREFGLKKSVRIPDKDLLNYMFKIEDVSFDGNQSEIKVSVPKKRYLSATKLDTFLSCKRKYYYKYIGKIGEPISYGFMKEERETGLAIHSIMEKELIHIDSISQEQMVDNCISRLKLLTPSSDTAEFNIALWSKRLSKFISLEYQQIETGAKITGVEKSFSFERNNITYSGIVDRIDTGANNSLLVSDYKTGKTPSLKVTGKGETIFQAEFYKMLIKENIKDKEVQVDFLYRNVKNSTYKKVTTSPAREQSFLSALDEFENDDGVYDMTTVATRCTFCPYKKSCGK